jgi:hypothetical protein
VVQYRRRWSVDERPQSQTSALIQKNRNAGFSLRPRPTLKSCRKQRQTLLCDHALAPRDTHASRDWQITGVSKHLDGNSIKPHPSPSLQGQQRQNASSFEPPQSNLPNRTGPIELGLVVTEIREGWSSVHVERGLTSLNRAPYLLRFGP